MRFGQLVVGPPGAGKTTYCKEVAAFLEQGKRKVAIVNLDPANDNLPYTAAIDVNDLVTIEDVMKHCNLGPNGSILRSMEYLEEKFDWLETELNKISPDVYLLFDCPGQIELYIDHSSVRNIISRLVKLDYRLVSVHIVDSQHCTDPAKFISVLLQTTASMIQLDLPGVNVISKLDIEEIRSKLPFQLDFFTEVLNLEYLLEMMSDNPFLAKYKKLNKALCDVIEDYSLVHFIPLNKKKAESMQLLAATIDKANGYILRPPPDSQDNQHIGSLLQYAMCSPPDTSHLWED